jgi:hypothetical protein
MPNITETSTFDAGVYQLEAGDLAQGGATGTSNKSLQNLANRTKYLKDHVDTLQAGGVGGSLTLNSPAITGLPTAPTGASDDNDLSIANTAFVTRALNGGTVITSTGGVVTATSAQMGNKLIQVSGALTQDMILKFAATQVGEWVIVNSTTGAFRLLVTDTLDSTNARGVYVNQGEARRVFNKSVSGDFRLSNVITGTATTTLQPWALKTADFSVAAGGRYVASTATAMTATLPATPQVGDEFTLKGNYFTNALTVDPVGGATTGTTQLVTGLTANNNGSGSFATDVVTIPSSYLVSPSTAWHVFDAASGTTFNSSVTTVNYYEAGISIPAKARVLSFVLTGTSAVNQNVRVLLFGVRTARTANAETTAGTSNLITTATTTENLHASLTAKPKLLFDSGQVAITTSGTQTVNATVPPIMQGNFETYIVQMQFSSAPNFFTVMDCVFTTLSGGHTINGEIGTVVLQDYHQTMHGIYTGSNNWALVRVS